MDVPKTNPTAQSPADTVAMLEEVFTLHKQDLFAFCFRRLGDPDQANDACGRIMLKALNGIGHFTPHPDRPGATLRAWLFRIARNDLIDHQRTTRWTDSLDRVDHDGKRVHDPPIPDSARKQLCSRTKPTSTCDRCCDRFRTHNDQSSNCASPVSPVMRSPKRST